MSQNISNAFSQPFPCKSCSDMKGFALEKDMKASCLACNKEEKIIDLILFLLNKRQDNLIFHTYKGISNIYVGMWYKAVVQ